MNVLYSVVGGVIGIFSTIVIVLIVIDNRREYLRNHPKEAVYRPYNVPPEWPYYVRAAILITLINIAVSSAVFLAPGTGLPPLWYRAMLSLSCLGLTLAVLKYTTRKIKAAKGTVE